MNIFKHNDCFMKLHKGEPVSGLKSPKESGVMLWHFAVLIINIDSAVLLSLGPHQSFRFKCLIFNQVDRIS